MTNTINYDVTVIGGGVSGVMAAVAAARLGAKVLLVEQYSFLGGSLTSMGVGPMMSFHNPAGEQVVRGLPQELVERLMASKGSPGHVPDTTTYCSTVTPFDSEELKLALEVMATESGVDILFHTKLAEVTVRDNRIESVKICNKSGLTKLHSNYWVDASGDGDLAFQAGVPYVFGRSQDNKAQPMTMNLKVGNVQRQALLEYVFANPHNFQFENGQAIGLERLKNKASSISLCGFISQWQEAKEKGEISIPRDNVLFFETASQGTFIFNTTRIHGFNVTIPTELSLAEMEGRRQCRELFYFLRKYCPGFESCLRMDSSSQIGVRESRHIQGIYELNEKDLLEQFPFDDVIALGGYPIDVHSPDGGDTATTAIPHTGAYSIPLRCLLPQKIGNLILSGRNLSATHSASAAVRVTPIAMAIGQAAGTSAAYGSQHSLSNVELPAREIQALLRQNGALLEA
jgi:hypothetical protein